MVCGAFVATTKAPLIFIPPKARKAANFIENVYKPGLIPFLHQHDPNRSCNLVLMEDSAPVHKAKLSDDFRHNKNITRLPNWPPQSPNLNPIENVWKVLKNNIQEFYHPRSISEMQHCLKLPWDDFPRQVLLNLIESMPESMQAVIDADRGLTPW